MQRGLRHPGHGLGQQRAGSATRPNRLDRLLRQLWLFGGYGYDATGSMGDLNDLWEYSERGVDLGQWLEQHQCHGVYGTRAWPRQQRAGSAPGRQLWIDSAGNLWLFGGIWL